MMLGISMFAQDEVTVVDEQTFYSMVAENYADSQSNEVDLSQFHQVSVMGEDGVAYPVAEFVSGNPDRLTAGVLAILLGGIGVQHFYTGQTVRGILDIVFCWTGIPAIIGLVEGIIWLCEDDASFSARTAKWAK